MSEKKHISRVFPAWAQEIIADPKASTEELKRAYAAEIVTERKSVASPQATRTEGRMKRITLAEENMKRAAQPAAGTTPDVRTYQQANCPKCHERITVEVLGLSSEGTTPQAERQYTHHVFCNGDRRKRPGTKGVCCSCFRNEDYKHGYVAGLIDSGLPEEEALKLLGEEVRAVAPVERPTLEQLLRCPQCKSADVIRIGLLDYRCQSCEATFARDRVAPSDEDLT